MKALFVIDMQEVCVGEHHAKFFSYDNKNLIKDVNSVIDENKDHLVIYIRNIMKRNLINKLAPFEAYDGMKEVELVEGLHILSDYVVDKYKGDAFSNTELLEILKSHNVDEIELIGVDGGGCVALTAFGALKNGYSIVINTKAIGTKFKKKQEKYFEKLRSQGAYFK